jgi:hypothetical protein
MPPEVLFEIAWRTCGRVVVRELRSLGLKAELVDGKVRLRPPELVTDVIREKVEKYRSRILLFLKHLAGGGQ